ncbi:Multifunctional protein ADE2 [Bagarius yarrelli]|uniref:Multifunctional protein ADE2 n=1 Tax=Bagarius yarrelli TaxID=175774 RepID=A0A556U6N9_BAGYA|nr:Multifunctional protein ADE2 [Bagarius yarrelli]
MEVSAKQKAGKEKEECQQGGSGRWEGEEVRALLVVWREREAWDETECRAKYEAISSRLKEMGVCRDWLSCQTQSRAMALPDWRPPAIHTSMDSTLITQRSFEMDRAKTSPASRGQDNSSLSSYQEGSGSQHFAPLSSMEGGRHWSDKEIRALLNVWADRDMQIQLQSTHRNKAIFQEMAHRLELQHGVVRDWRQCRTKYKNLKYDYKVSCGQGRTMRFFAEMDAILQGRDTEDYHEEVEDSPRKVTEEDRANERRKPEDAHYIKIDDGSSVSPGARRPSDEENVITVYDSGRNWSEYEVAALLNIWSEDGIQEQLHSSTRNKDVFVQISRRLLQQGVERDWKQCRTKYKNLKYLYRSLQRGKADIGDTRRIMKFYKQLDSILSQPATGLYRNLGMFSPSTSDGHCEMPAHEDSDVVAVEYDQRVTARAYQNKAGTDAILRLDELEYKTEDELHGMLVRSKDGIQTRHEQSLSGHSVQAATYGEDQEYKAIKDCAVFSKRFQECDDDDDGNSSTDWSEHVDYQCKEEQDHYIPIMEISSVRSIADVTDNLDNTIPTEMASTGDLKLGKKLSEGKTKQIFELLDMPGQVLVQSKDQITAGNAVRKDQMEGKAAISNKTTSCIFKLLQEAGIKTAFVKQHSETAFIASHCEMIPIEWVCRRIATGSFLKRNPGVKEGYRFSPLKMEMFFKDDANNDPQWSEEQLLAAGFDLAGLTIGRCEVDIMSKSTVAIFEVLEKAWTTQNCTLVDMKIEFGVNVITKEVVLADVIDNDSWRLWPAGDRNQQKDKQVYRDLKEVTPEAMQVVKRNFEWVAERVQLLLESQTSGRVVVLMGSTSDMAHSERIRKACGSYGIPCHLRVTSAHKGPDETLRIKSEYEGDGIPTIFIAVAGRSNGLGPVMSGNTVYPVINCPPVTSDWGAQDIWSSLRMPSGLGCSTILSPDAAGQHAAQILGLTDHLVWAKLRASMLNTWITLKQADKKLQQCSI